MRDKKEQQKYEFNNATEHLQGLIQNHIQELNQLASVDYKDELEYLDSIEEFLKDKTKKLIYDVRNAKEIESFHIANS